MAENLKMEVIKKAAVSQVIFITFLVALILLVSYVCNLRGQEPGNPTAVVCFTATWCTYCPQMKPVWADLKRQGVNTLELDLDRDKAMAARYGVTRVPTTVVVYKAPDNKLREYIRVTGVTTKSKLEGYIAAAQKEKP